MSPAPSGTLPTPEATGSSAGPETAVTSPAAEPTATSTPAPDITQGNEILNILLIGVDRRQDTQGDSKGTDGGRNGTEPHADVQMVLAINFKEKKVDLISLPRDTFVYNPDLMNGVYKLNATFNTAGGFAAKDGAGFLNVCKGASYMLGGIPIDYYYAVDFDSLVKIVDTIGGVDFNIDSPDYSLEQKKGMQHMNGEDVLYYVRVRKVGPEPGDLNRINRQKELMVAIFTQLKEKGKLSMVPNLIGAADSGIFTNTNLEQTLALANFAKSVDPKNITMHSMAGPSIDAIYWRWCFTDQEKRVELIKQVYGVDVPGQVHCSEAFAHWLNYYGFGGIVYQKTAKQLIDYADAHKADFTGDQEQAYNALTASYAKTQQAWNNASLTLKDADTSVMLTAMNHMKTDAAQLAKQLNYTEILKWTYDHHYWWLDPEINEVQVDFN
jgi:LCP family protein required for cell wall assembly